VEITVDSRCAAPRRKVLRGDNKMMMKVKTYVNNQMRQ
jgi:hypothetical protein